MLRQNIFLLFQVRNVSKLDMSRISQGENRSVFKRKEKDINIGVSVRTSNLLNELGVRIQSNFKDYPVIFNMCFKIIHGLRKQNYFSLEGRKTESTVMTFIRSSPKK